MNGAADAPQQHPIWSIEGIPAAGECVAAFPIFLGTQHPVGCWSWDRQYGPAVTAVRANLSALALVGGPLVRGASAESAGMTKKKRTAVDCRLRSESRGCTPTTERERGSQGVGEAASPSRCRSVVTLSAVATEIPSRSQSTVNRVACDYTGTEHPSFRLAALDLLIRPAFGLALHCNRKFHSFDHRIATLSHSASKMRCAAKDGVVRCI